MVKINLEKIKSKILSLYKDKGDISFAIVGVGGQGAIHLGKRLFSGLECQFGKTISMEERGFSKKRGSVLVCLRAGEKAYRACPSSGKVDVYIALEKQEFLRQIHLVNKDSICILANTLIENSLSIKTNFDKINKLIEEALALTSLNNIIVDAPASGGACESDREVCISQNIDKLLSYLIGTESRPPLMESITYNCC